MCPRLANGLFNITSPKTSDYNCIAWAAGRTDIPWWPIKAPGVHWPSDCELKATRESFICAFRTLNYEECANGDLETGYEKVAIFADERGVPTHAARQLTSGAWTSKLGQGWDIEHPHYKDVEGETNGEAKVFLRRPTGNGSTSA